MIEIDLVLVCATHKITLPWTRSAGSDKIYVETCYKCLEDDRSKVRENVKRLL